MGGKESGGKESDTTEQLKTTTGLCTQIPSIKIPVTAFKVQSRDLPDGPVVKNLPGNAGDRKCGYNPWVRKIPWRMK